MVADLELADEEIDRLFRALADATRRDIVRRTLDRATSVTELADAYDMSWAAVQKHVAVLERAGLVTKAAHGRRRLVAADVDQLARARRALTRLEDLWRARFGQLDDVLADAPPDGDPAAPDRRGT